MDITKISEKLSASFSSYYTIKNENLIPPFDMEAEFHSHGEQYILVKVAKIADIDSNDYAYFKFDETLTTENLSEYIQKAWESGLALVKPYNGHRNSDITLVIIAENIEESAKKLIKKCKLSKSYKFSFWGWSNFRLIAKELSSNKVFYNRFGENLKKVVANIN